MIKEHEFNTNWWGKSVGVITEAAFFDLNSHEREKLLSEYAWVEYKAMFHGGLPLTKIYEAGFFFVGAQIPFRIPLRRVAPSTSTLEKLTAVSADENPFRIELDEMASFQHERFAVLPGITETKLNERYVLMARDLIARSPAWCLRVLEGSSTQGWFLSEKKGDMLHLVLAMLHRDAHFSGQQLYHKALATYASRGERMGYASFEMTNTAVHNIYSHLGARFLHSEGIWLWIQNRTGRP